eukprot:gene8783-18054_t
MEGRPGLAREVRFLSKFERTSVNASRWAANWGQQSLGTNRGGNKVAENFIRETLCISPMLWLCVES